jgi:hypothetical protein
MRESEVVTNLENSGLLVKPNPVGPYAGGWTIAKPASIPGNTRKNWEVYFGSDEILCDAPVARLYLKGGKWVFQVADCVPGPEPGDFQEEFLLIIDAVDAIFDYYFGEPSKMNPPELLTIELD